MIRLRIALFLLLLPMFGPALSSDKPVATEVGVIAALIKAEFALQAGQLEEAARHYLEAAAQADDPALAERATRIAIAANDREATRAAVARWRVLAPQQPTAIAQGVALALVDGEYEAAMDSARLLLGYPGREGWPLLLRALAESEGDARIIARAVLSALPEESAMPPRIDPWLAFAGLARRLGDSETSVRLVDRALQRFPDDPSAQLLVASRQRERGELVAARKALVRLLESPVVLSADLRRSAARELAAAGDPVKAAELLGRVASSDEDVALRAGWLVAADAREQLVALKRELTAADGQQLARRALWLGHISEALMQWQDAEKWYRQVADRDRERAQLRLVAVLLRMARNDDAIAELRKLQGDDKADGEWVREAFVVEADMHASGQRDAEVLDAYERGLSVFEADPMLLYRRAMYLERSGRVREALADLQEILGQDPENASALNAYGYLLVVHQQRYEEALPLLERALRLAPDAPEVLDSLGWLKHRLGRNDEALPLLQRAWAGLRDAEIAAHLGEVLWQLQRVEEAREVWRQALALEPRHPALQSAKERLTP